MIDSLVFHEWPSPTALTPYMSEGYRELIERPNDISGPLQMKAAWLYRRPGGVKRAGGFDGEAPRADVASFITQFLDRNKPERVVLGYDDGVLATGWPAYYPAQAFVRAANDWTADQWLKQDPRLYGLILVSVAMPELAAAEIRRMGANPRMVGVALGANALGLPFGHPVYHPIYRAAAEMGLPLVIQAGSDGLSDQDQSPVAGGLPATYSEYHVLSAQSHMHHVSSMIVNSVFDLHPGLQVLLVGGGATWVPGYLWRFDSRFAAVSAGEAPWLRRPPSAYFANHFRLATYSLESPRQPAQLAKALTTLPGIDSLLLYTSGYPGAEAETTESIAARLPAEWHAKVFGENARSFFRWPDQPRRTAVPAIDRAVLDLPDRLGQLTRAEAGGQP